jgi:hypothetical protein
LKILINLSSEINPKVEKEHVAVLRAMGTADARMATPRGRGLAQQQSEGYWARPGFHPCTAKPPPKQSLCQ